jgi:hypothetical protein
MRNCVKKCEYVALNFGENRPGCFTMTTPRLTLSSSPSSFWQNTSLLSFPTHRTPDLAPCDFLLFPKMKFKLKGHRFDTTEEIQAESPRVFDTLTEKDFQEAFQTRRRRWDRCLHEGGNYFGSDGGR